MTVRLFQADSYSRTCEARVLAQAGERGLILDQTVFYPTGGGQPGDQGILRWSDGLICSVVNTVYGDDGAIVHLIADEDPLPREGTRLAAEIDWERRHVLMRYHTCLHLLCSIVDAPVTGGRMAEDKAHLDFDIEMSALDAAAIESRLNDLIRLDLAVAVSSVTDAELDANPGLVKTMSVQPPRGQGTVRTIEIPGVDLQPCGGTHLARIGEIGTVRVIRIRSEGKRNKRVTIQLA